MRVLFRSLSSACLLVAVAAGVAVANTSHEGWPTIDGVLLMNKTDSTRPLDARPGQDPFGGTDSRYSCDAVHVRGACHRRFVPHFEAAAMPAQPGSVRPWQYGFVMSSQPGHNELLGGHGSDTIHAGPWGDVIWGDYKPSGQPANQVDHLYGGAGNDIIYGSHGSNVIDAGAGNDEIKTHFGRGTVDCGPGNDLLYISRHARRGYKVRGCERISHKTLGY
ncbi:MAG TPA: calcium-binding protein [Baekduia sp.]|uniref:calcium-binding protein n=1 Tax=Baekduia sp. TaxID=2600305 RepID=UPI002BA247D3|nr:calcium-binding protein [Baekduia sp.]HMJ35168.1 calcium-binding protein [Baekduia sp.]